MCPFSIKVWTHRIKTAKSAVQLNFDTQICAVDHQQTILTAADGGTRGSYCSLLAELERSSGDVDFNLIIYLVFVSYSSLFLYVDLFNLLAILAYKLIIFHPAQVLFKIFFTPTSKGISADAELPSSEHRCRHLVLSAFHLKAGVQSEL